MILHKHHKNTIVLPPTLLIFFELYVSPIIGSLPRHWIYPFAGMKFTVDSLPKLVEAITTADAVKQLWGIIGIRKLVSLIGIDHFQKIFTTRILPHIVKLATQTQYMHMKFQAVWALSIIVSRYKHQYLNVIQLGEIQLFIELLQSNEEDIACKAAWGIGNIAQYSNGYKFAIFQKGGVSKIVKLIKNLKSDKKKEDCFWALAIICYVPARKYLTHIREAILTICEHIKNSQGCSENLHLMLISIINYLQETKQYEILFESGIMPMLLKILQENKIVIKAAVLKILSSASKDNKHMIQVLLSLDIMKCIQDIIKIIFNPFLSNTEQLLIELFRFLNAFASGTKEQSQVLIQKQEFLKLVFSVFQMKNSYFCGQIISFFAILAQKAPNNDLFHLFKDKKIVQKTVDMLKKDLNLNSNPEKNLSHLLVLLEFGNRFKQNGENVFATDFIKAKGRHALEKLACCKNERIFNSVQLLETFFESG